MPESRKDTARAAAASARKDYLRALEEELVGYERHGREDRVKDVKAEIARVKKAAPTGRTAPASDTAAGG